MQFPVPRGVFVMTNEVNFCDGYNDAVSNRSEFPLGQGFISLNSEHPSWSADVLISIEQNPTNFSVFNQSLTGVELPFAVPIFKASGEGLACIAIDIGNLGIPGVGDGSNVTIQVQFNGGDGNLFQCADLTLSSSFTIPSDVNCTHLVSNTTVSNSSSTATSTSSTSTSSNGALSLLAGNSGFFGLIVAGILSFL
ncbi:hypothetical protein EW145_g5038 [Phellinidium pouzarii]|uniref:Copper acquisition factor BIM1-like domain-containing protein n=1 Tax=Phellinidium pouzarii TaxID=167371 RepID=A0A4S4L691_9AGAM|nr:hypothetical protein EW145_g5038 [Phellinidium pouzarii]